MVDTTTTTKAARPDHAETLRTTLQAAAREAQEHWLSLLSAIVLVAAVVTGAFLFGQSQAPSAADAQRAEAAAEARAFEQSRDAASKQAYDKAYEESFAEGQAAGQVTGTKAGAKAGRADGIQAAKRRAQRESR